jgi:putative GTP pyrophosphokinase
MTSLEDVRGRWTKDQAEFGHLGIELAEALKKEIRKKGIWANVTSRPKDMDSLIRKLVRKPHYTYESLIDKAGVRVIVRYKGEITPVLDIAQHLFDISDLENTIGRLGPDTVGYLSVHSVARFRPDDARALKYPPDQFRAELQVRTLAQHLWAEMAHDTIYKNDDTLRPLANDLKRRVFILAGLIELADEEFNRIEQEMPSVPGLEMLKALDRHFYKVTTRRGDPETSLDIIRLLTPLYGMNTEEIIAHLDEFYATHEEVLQHVYRQAEDTPDRSAFLFQPEALMIYDLLETDQLRLRRVWNERYPEKELERIANAFGISFD